MNPNLLFYLADNLPMQEMARPYLEAAADLGYSSFAILEANNFKSTGLAHYFKEVYSSAPRELKFTERIVDKHSINYIVPINEWVIRLSSILKEKYGLHGLSFNDSNNLLFKNVYGNLLEKERLCSIPQSIFISAKCFEDPQWDIPIFVKPTLSVSCIPMLSCDYQQFQNAIHLKNFLVKNGQLDVFLDNNNSPKFRGQHLVQKMISVKKRINASVFFLDKTYKIIHTHQNFWKSEPKNDHLVKSICLPPEISEKIHQVCSFFSKNYSLRGSFASFQFLIDFDDNLFANDLNFRMGEVYSLFLRTLKSDVFRQSLEFIFSIRGEIQFPRENFYQRVLDLEDSSQKSINFPPLSKSEAFYFTDSFKSLTSIPQDKNWLNFLPKICLTANGDLDFESRYTEILSSIEYTNFGVKS